MTRRLRPLLALSALAAACASSENQRPPETGGANQGGAAEPLGARSGASSGQAPTGAGTGGGQRANGGDGNGSGGEPSLDAGAPNASGGTVQAGGGKAGRPGRGGSGGVAGALAGAAGIAGASGAAGGGVVTYTTKFDRAETRLSEDGAWQHEGLDWTYVRTSGGLAYGTQTGEGGYDDSYAYLSGFPPDQSASGVVHIGPDIDGGTTHEVEILLRWSDSAHEARGYECNFAYDGQYADIIRWNGPKGDFTFLVPTLTAEIPGGLHDGDTVSAKIVGNRITTYVNGDEILSVTDAAFTDGNPGIGFFRGDPSGPMNDFAFKEFSATSVTK